MIHLRPLTLDDLPTIVAACQDPEIPRWTLVPQPYTEADALAFLATSEPRRVIAGDEDDRLLGIVGIPWREGEEVEFGYWLAAEARGRGVMPRALALAGEWAREEFGARRAKLLVHEDNAASLATARRAGFKDLGERSPCTRGGCAQTGGAHHVVLRRDLV